jgi:hypothetical protein
MPRINPAPSPAVSSDRLASPVIKAPVSRPANLPPAVAPLRATTSARPQSTDDTPLLPEQSAFQLPDSFVNDVQQVASKTGYVGLTSGAIQRAYLQGEGLFVDISA